MNSKKLTLVFLAASLALQPMLAAGALNSLLTYNPGGRLQQLQLPQGQTYQYTYDQAGQVASFVQPNPGGSGTGASIGYAHDGRGALSTLTDPRGLATSYGVLGTGEVTSQASPDTGSTSYVRDGAGRITSKTDGRGTVNFGWDAIGRLTSATYADAVSVFNYDNTQVGKLGGIQDASGSTTFNYDAQGHITTRSQLTTGPTGGAGANLTVQQAFDTAGRLSQITYPSGRVVGFAYDASRVTGITVDGVSALSNVQYQPFGPPVSWQMGTAGAYTRGYDTAGHMTSYTYDAGQRTLTWDDSNRVTGILNPGGVQWTYGYDNLDRLVSASESTQGVRSFGWDSTGNRSSTTINGAAYPYAVDAGSNRLTTSTAPSVSASYTYDGAGQITGDGSRAYTWTKAGYLATALSPQGSASYSYNAFGQRVKKVVGGGARHYLYAEDGVSLLGEYGQASAGASIASLYEVVYLEGIPVIVLAGGQTYFIQSDHLNSPRTVKNSAGATVWRWESDAFGNGAANQNPGGVQLFEFNPRFPGQQFDAESGLYYNNSRYYDPVTGRYVSSDPIGLGGGANTFTYAGGSPAGLADPSGLDVWIEKGNQDEPFLHQSISIGSPQGFYVSYSYGVVTAPFHFGAVYTDYEYGGRIEQYKRTTPLQDAELIQRISRLVGTAPGLYGVTEICRSWSQDQFAQAPGRVSIPPVAYATRDGLAPKKPRKPTTYTSVLSMPFSSTGTSTSR